VLLRGNPASAATGPGHPDIDGVVRSRPIALEIKKARGKPTPLQILRLKDLRDAGCYAWIVRSPAEACDAVYWVAKGWTRPLSNEPLDLNAWLMGSPPKEEAPPFEPAAVEPPALGSPPSPEHERAEGDFNFGPLTSPYTEEHAEAAAHVLGFESAAQRAEVDRPRVPEGLYQVEAPREPALAHSGDPAPGMELAMLEGLVTMMENHIADLRTVGDRVTLVYERVDHFLAVLVAVDQKLNRLLQMVDDDPTNGEVVGVEITEQVLEQQPVAPTPAKRTRRKKAEATPTVLSGEARADIDNADAFD